MGRHHKITLGDRCHGNPQLLIQVFIKRPDLPFNFLLICSSFYSHVTIDFPAARRAAA